MPEQSTHDPVVPVIRSTKPVNCRIQLRGMLDARWADYIGEFSLTGSDEASGPVSTLTGSIADQSALLGTLLYLNQLGLALLSIEWNNSERGLE